MNRFLNFTLAAPGLLVLGMPLLALLLQACQKPGSPAFLRQKRPGMKGRPFEKIKFRIMTDVRGPAGDLFPDAQHLTYFGRFLR